MKINNVEMWYDDDEVEYVVRYDAMDDTGKYLDTRDEVFTDAHLAIKYLGDIVRQPFGVRVE